MSVLALTMAFSDLKWIKSRYGERESDPFRAFIATATTTTTTTTTTTIKDNDDDGEEYFFLKIFLLKESTENCSGMMRSTIDLLRPEDFRDDSMLRRESYVDGVAKNFKAIERELVEEVVIGFLHFLYTISVMLASILSHILYEVMAIWAKQNS
uniref:Uncharacterized protein n=1 Tax=Glossina austeni TaxID=7395 RepID=A0A1A9UPS2_GLOAU